MPAVVRQTWTLVQKNLLIAALRRPISTSLRALVIPLTIVLVVSYAQYFFNPSQHFGVGHPRPLLDLTKAIPRGSASRNTVVFVDNGLTGGEIAAVIEEVAEPFRKAGKSVVVLHNETDLVDVCRSSQRGTSSCFAAAVFLSSASQPVKGGVWNYTLRADQSLGGTVNVDSPNNDAQVYLLPLQNAIDRSIVARAPKGNSTALEGIQQFPYTVESEQKHKFDNRQSYLNAGIAYFGIVLFLAMVPVVYHLAGVMASEREQGLSQLIEAMMPNPSRWQPQAARLLSYHGAFSIIYFPSWLACGIVISTVVFIKTSSAIVILYHLTAGLALSSYAILGGSFFKKSQVCGITMIVIVICLAIVPQVLLDDAQTPATVTALSLLFPSSNYIYFISTIARWEVADMPANLSKTPDQCPWKLRGATMWAFLVIQILVYPLLAAVVEQILFGTSSKNRRLHSGDRESEPTVRLRNFGKIYKRNWVRGIFSRKESDVHAVHDLSLDARKGQILMLLGPNGSGKSTTLDAVAGLSKISSGSIDIDGTGGLGITPQRNVLWDDLTVAEHVRILYKLKIAEKRSTKADLTALIEGCDLVPKAEAKSKTLSGGQKRKLQLAMMFAGGSSVCCVDEASSGLDPLSRRKIWDILLAERGDRTIIMTTHFLDEADFLSDHIVILSKGDLKAQGSSAGLKNNFGNGYSISVPMNGPSHAVPDIHGIAKKRSLDQVIYIAADSTQAARVIHALEGCGIEDFKISGPTLEDLFLKLTGTSIHSASSQEKMEFTNEKAQNSDADSVPSAGGVNLHHGRHIGPLQQTSISFQKRWIIVRRNYMPYVGALKIALLGAGVSLLFLKSFKGMECAIPKYTGHSYASTGFSESLASRYSPSFVGGPGDRISADALADVADIYSPDHTVYGSSGIKSVNAFKDAISPAETLEDFTRKVAANNATLNPGAFWLGDASSSPQFAWKAEITDIGGTVMVQNLIDNLLTNVSISTSYSNFDIPPSPRPYSFGVLLFVMYFSLVFCLYPGFFAIYPTIERLRNVRALHYSNGVRSLPLWLAYLAFDSCFIVVISVVSTALLSVGTGLWYHLPYIFWILVLYGISSAILSYIISMIARSHLAAWAFCVGGQVFMCLAYFAAYLGIQSNVDVGDLDSMLNKVHFTIALISPIANVMRALFISLNQFLLLCGRKADPGSITLYGGPLLYLVLQSLALFSILLWIDSGFSILDFIKGKKSLQETEAASTPMPADVAAEVTRVKQTDIGLRVLHLSKQFGKNTVVDDVTFGVQRGEVFALLGPNGAGKSKTPFQKP